ncbi:3-oxoacyl-[acyl-carrier-protein] synthase 3 [Andreesenia angusta]|uniref:Beta-ketoacyl-[acyl-carrier-protein] synthase III n=1 Tax=Andreesenia angusta TaxID=39480 RepID=A0A1S1VAC2_9FIRM|nr:beta-ketoacyl-ACP synthase III [Andreesenia angusta]OHW62669.1 3-oxoacyl-[acyl-carrier-protein] synthase 3 [Andreesenia angusta]
MNKRGFNAGILGIGSYVPEKKVTNFDLEKMVETSDEWITTRTGIKERRVVEEGQHTSDLALEASKKALEDAKMTPEDIDLIIVATMSPDLPTPATACFLQDKLGCTDVPSFDISAACSGFIYGLSIATAYVNSGLYKNILLVGAEAMSRIVDWTDRSTCILFGDGAGAVVVGKVPEDRGVLGFEMGSDGSGAKHLLIPSGGVSNPNTEETLESRENYIKMDGSEVFKFAVRRMDQVSKNVLEKLELEVEDIDLLVPHQANIRIIDSAVKKLKIDYDKVVVNLDKYGNMSAASIPVALDEAVKSGRVSDGDKVLIVGFGGGLTWGASVISWHKDKEAVYV